MVIYFLFLSIACSHKNTQTNPIQDRPIPTQAGNVLDRPTNEPPNSASQPILTVALDCQDISKASNEICQRLYAPVCGCNKVTYTNACLARREGILKYTDGICKTY